MSVVFWRKHSYTLLWSCIAVLISLVLLCQLIGGLLTSRHHYVQARYAYQLLVLLPFQRAASQVRLGDTYYASHDYANATSCTRNQSPRLTQILDAQSTQKLEIVMPIRRSKKMKRKTGHVFFGLPRTAISFA